MLNTGCMIMQDYHAIKLEFFSINMHGKIYLEMFYDNRKYSPGN